MELIRSGHWNGGLGRVDEKINGQIRGYGSPMAWVWMLWTFLIIPYKWVWSRIPFYSTFTTSWYKFIHLFISWLHDIIELHSSNSKPSKNTVLWNSIVLWSDEYKETVIKTFQTVTTFRSYNLQMDNPIFFWYWWGKCNKLPQSKRQKRKLYGLTLMKVKRQNARKVEGDCTAQCCI